MTSSTGRHVINRLPNNSATPGGAGGVGVASPNGSILADGGAGAGSASKSSTLQRKKIKRKKSMIDQKKWIFKGRISTELMEIENLEDGTSECSNLEFIQVEGEKFAKLLSAN